MISRLCPCSRQYNRHIMHQRNGFLLRSLSVLIFQLLLTQFCRGQSRLIGPLQPIVAKIGDDIILPCYLKPAQDVFAMTLEWTRSDLNSMFVYVCRDGQDLIHTKHPYYKDRTSLSTDELKHGNVSLKLSKVKLTDQGKYKCYIPKLETTSSVDLVVDDFIEVQSSYFAATVGLAVSLAVSVLLIVLLFILWKRRQNKTERSNKVETENREKKNDSKSNKTDDQFVTEEESERENLMSDEAVQMEDLNKKKSEQLEEEQQLLEEQHRSEEAENTVKVQKEELETKKKEENAQQVTQAQGNTNSDSATRHIVVEKVDPKGKYVELRNTSHEDQQIQGWELHVRVNNRKPIIQTFPVFVFLKDGGTTKVDWKRKFCKAGDRLLITLYSDTGEIKLRQMLEIGNSQIKFLELDTSSASHDPVTGHIIVDEVDPDGKYVRLKNKSDKKKQMELWELHIQVDNRKPIIYTFDSKFKLNPGQTVTIWSKESGFTPNPPTDLVSSESWSSGNQLLVTLYSNTREEVSMKKVDNTNV